MYIRIGNKIKRARIDRGFSQHELGAALGLTATAINYYEKGKRKISIEDIYRLATTLKKPLAYFLSDSDHLISKKTAGKIKPENCIASLVKIPVLGVIHAGESLCSEQNLLGYLPVPGEKAAKGLFALKVKGNSMDGKGICDGDLVLLRRQDHVDFIGQVVCALINEIENSLKIYLEEEDRTILRSANPSYPDIIFENDGSVVIQGVYAGVFKFP
ncbi:MAG: S24 family peptidase [Desulfotomaculaceae bacterium]|nr:S24 family peptidase [Desulfotomaculaceae bacterium]